MCFEVRAPSSTSPPSPRRISNPLTCPPRTRTEGTSTENFANTTGSTELLSQPIQPPPRQSNTTIHLYRRGIQTNSNSTSPRGSIPQSQPLPKREQPTTQINLYQRRISQNKGFTAWWLQRPQTITFPTKTKDPIE